jgi:Domain of unknown function (DUF6268)
MNLARSRRAAVVCVVLILARLSYAGPEEIPQGSEPIVETPTSSSLSFKLSGEYTGEETYIGEASVSRGHKLIDDFDESDSTLQFVLTPRVSFGVLRLGFQYERFSFGFPDQTPLPNTLQSGSLVLGLDTSFSDSILLRFEAQPGFYGTNDFNSSNFSVPFLVGGTYIYNPDLQFIAGVSVDVERKYPVLPTAGIRWKFAPQWVANAVLPTPRIEYEANKGLTLYAGGVFKETNFRVQHDFAANLKNKDLGGTVLTYSEVRAGVGADWKISSVITLSAEAGYQPYRTFDFYRADVRFDQESSAPYGTISLHGSF